MKVKVITVLLIPLTILYLWYIYASAEKCQELRFAEIFLDSFLGRQRDVAFRSSEFTMNSALATLGLSLTSAIFLSLSLIFFKTKFIRIVGTTTIISSVVMVIFGAIMLSSPDTVPLDKYSMFYYAYGILVIFTLIVSLIDFFPRQTFDNDLLDSFIDDTD